jgi:hypothetical protein
MWYQILTEIVILYASELDLVFSAFQHHLVDETKSEAILVLQKPNPPNHHFKVASRGQYEQEMVMSTLIVNPRAELLDDGESRVSEILDLVPWLGSGPKVPITHEIRGH